MTRYRFELAAPADDADLRGILARTPMQGSISICFCREPSYFDAAVVEGRFRQVVAARDTDSGHLVGFGARSITPRFVAGEPRPVGYLSSLRLLAEHRSRGLVARGYRYFRQLHGDGRANLYLTTIAVENHAAAAILTSERAGLPRYRPAGDYHSIAISLRHRWRDCPTPRGITIRAASQADVPSIIQFLDTVGPQRQYFPQYKASDLLTDHGLLRGLKLEDLFLAMHDGQLAGVAGFWDQRSFRQTLVHGYHGAIRVLRPLNNALAPLLGWPSLPAAGRALQSAYVALPVVKHDNAEVFMALLREVAGQAARKNLDYLLLGLHERDWLLPAVKTLPGRWYITRLYLVSWDDHGAAELVDRPPYLELGCL